MATRVHAHLDRPAAQANQQVEALADRSRLTAAHMVHQPGLAAERYRDQGPRHVPDIDKIAAGLEIANQERQWVSHPCRQLSRKLSESLGWRQSGSNGIEHTGDGQLQRWPLRQARDRGEQLAAAVGLKRRTRISLGNRQGGWRYGPQLG